MPTNPYDFPRWATPSQLFDSTTTHLSTTHPISFRAGSSSHTANMSDAQTKKFGKGDRTIPSHSQKAQKWYPVDDEPQPKKVSNCLYDSRASVLRMSALRQSTCVRSAVHLSLDRRATFTACGPATFVRSRNPTSSCVYRFYTTPIPHFARHWFR